MSKNKNIRNNGANRGARANRGTRNDGSQSRLSPYAGVVASSEIKYVDADPGSTVDTSGALVLLNGLAPGTGVNQRVGRRVVALKLGFRLSFSVTAATGADQFQRFIVVRDRQSNGTAPVVTDVILSTGGINAQRNFNNAMRFQYLVDQVYHLNASAEPGSQKEVLMDVPVRAIVQFNSGTAGTVADIVTNSLYLLVMGSNAPGVTAGSLVGSVRFYFQDA